MFLAPFERHKHLRKGRREGRKGGGRKEEGGGKRRRKCKAATALIS